MKISKRKLWFPLALSLTLAPNALAQAQDRLHAPIDARRQAPLKNSVNPRIGRLADDGPLAAAEFVRGISLRFKPTAKQSADLQRLLDEQRNPSSPLYHAWLSPEEFADRFGMSANDYARVAQWLESEGLQVEGVSRSRTSIRFSATAASVRRALGADLHRFRVHGRSHFATVTEPRIPADLEPLIQTVTGLDNLPDTGQGRVKPRMKLRDGRNALGPGDLATIYNMNPLLEKGYDGAGQKIVVAGKSALRMDDLREFRKFFGLPPNDPQVILVPGNNDPGENEEFYEATSDVEIAGAIARNASVLYVYAPNAFEAVEYAIDQNLAPVISYSFGSCERNEIQRRNQILWAQAVTQQANAQGITIVASSGDTGVAGCELQFKDSIGVSGMSVLLPAAFPEVTAVGGTMFVEGGGNYWSPDNVKGTSTALSYIPEAVWNETSSETLGASGSGASLLFPKPSWQSGPGVPNVNARLVPDVSFAAAWDHDLYVIFADGMTQGWGGTSAAAPVFAGVLTILNQYLVSTGAQSKPGLGNVNPRLYQMAQTTPGVFHDITSGDNFVPCKIGTPDCATGRYGHTAGPGWDAATGLGSLDVNNFVLNWAGGSSSTRIRATTLALTADAYRVPASGSIVLTATVRPDGGSGLPAGSVHFASRTKSLGHSDLTVSGGVASATLTVKASELEFGDNPVSAFYTGSSTFLPSTGLRVVAVSRGSSVTVSADPATVYRQAPDPEGFPWRYRLNLTETAGESTTVTGFVADGIDYSAQVATILGGTTLPARGTLTIFARTKSGNAPFKKDFVFSGIDADGQRWRRELTVSFMAEQAAPALSLLGSPPVVRQQAKPSSSCSAERPMYHEVRLEELSGVTVRLTRFVADSVDLSDQIQARFGSSRLAAFGTLTARFCWPTGDLPRTRNFEVEGVDGEGRSVKASVQVSFKTAPLIPGTLSVSKSAIQLSSASESASDALNITLPGDEAWTVTAVPGNQGTGWLSVSPKSGRGPAQITVTAAPTGLVTGAHMAKLIFQSENTTPQVVEVPVIFMVRVSGLGTITGAQNAASFQRVFAPGMLASLYGTKLANSTQSATSLPLPLTIDGVTVTVNGVHAPIWFVSPGQINFQIPYETPIGSALVIVTNNGQVSTDIITVTPTAPGIFNRGGAVVPSPSADRGGGASIYITGEGELTPMVETGAPPPAGVAVSQLPKPRGSVTVTVGGVPAEVTFIGTPWLVGVTQVNFTLAAGTPTGPQPVVVTIGGVSSAPQTLTVR